jgi:hypothetical protein
MEYRPMNVYERPELHGPAGRALLACGLWMRLGFVGASAAAIGLIELVGNEVRPLSALALAVGGAALAVLSWRRAHAALTQDADVPATTAAGPSGSGGVRTVASA